MDPSRINRPGGLRGEQGLLVAVIAQAVKDATRGSGEERGDAWRYLASREYEQHLCFLGLPSTFLPVEIEEAAKHVQTERLLVTE